MTNQFSFKKLVVALAIAMFTFSAHAGELFLAKGQPVQDRFIVVFKKDAFRGSDRAAAMQQVASRAGARLLHVYNRALNGGVFGMNEKLAAALARHPMVSYVEQDQIVRASAVQNGATWGLDRIDQRDLPLDSSYTYNTNASNVHAYIVDTGIRSSHNEFGGRVSTTEYFDAFGDNGEDCNGHGTHVAGTVGGSTYGVAKNVQLYKVRVLDCNGSGTNSGVIGGVDWVAQNHRTPAVANMSLGGGLSTALNDAVANAVSAGVTFVVAAGNENQNACNVSPASEASAITVGSTTSSDVRSSFSNYGSCVDIFAPGSNITAAWHTGNSATNTISGTSMASPHVAGAAALILADNPGFSPAQVTQALLNSASTGKLSSINTGSPNLLLYSLDGTDPGTDPDPDPEPGDTVLNNGDSRTLSGTQGQEFNFTLAVPAGASNLDFTLSGGSGDADLYVKMGSAPTTSSYDYRSWNSSNNENINIGSPSNGTYHILVRGYSSFNNATLTVSYTEPGSGGGGGTTTGTAEGTLSSSNREDTYTITVSGGVIDLSLVFDGSRTDLDLYLYYGDTTSSSAEVARAYTTRNPETISYDTNGAAGTYTIRVHNYNSRTSNYTLTATWEE